MLYARKLRKGDKVGIVSLSSGMLEEIALMEEPLRKLAQKYYPSLDEVETEMKSPALNHVRMFRIEIDHMTGKLVNER